MGKVMGNRLLKRYVDDHSGQFAVWTAILALPISLMTSMVIDLQTMNNSKTNLKSALDSAALAAVTNQTLSTGERRQYAKDRFWLNVNSKEKIDFDVPQADSYRVEVSAEMQLPTLMSSIIGKKSLSVTETSVAELTKGSTVCMLTLDTDSARAFEVSEGATLDASTCGIQVNSINRQASVIDLGGKAVAESFCIAGGAEGEHLPYANTQCSLLENPYKALTIPDPGPCIDQAKLEALMLDWRSGRDSVEEHEVLEYQRWADANAAGQTWYPTFFEKSRLQPGNYCEGLFLEGLEFELDPGVYHITGNSLVFGLGTELHGKGVTFVLHNNAGVEIRDGSILNIKGPSSGPLTGLVLAQELGNKPLNSTKYPDAVSTITSGSIVNFLGTVYLPSHKIEFLGGSLSETRAPATSFISHHISIRDGAKIGVAVDHVAADIPPILPRSDSGARLVQ